MKVRFSLVSLFHTLLMMYHVAGNQGGAAGYLRTTKGASSSSSGSSPDSDCSPNPCQNNGHCQSIVVNDSHQISCLCAFGYYGPFCSETDDPLTLKYAKPSSSMSIIAGEGDDKEEGHPTKSKDDRRQEVASEFTSKWFCYTEPSTYQGTVDIWWGHSDGDATWACNSWVAECAGYCFAVSAVSGCWERDTYCLVGTSCNSCCHGWGWSWERFGAYCM